MQPFALAALLALHEAHPWVTDATTTRAAPRGAQRRYNSLQSNDDYASLCLAGLFAIRHPERTLAAV